MSSIGYNFYFKKLDKTFDSLFVYIEELHFTYVFDKIIYNEGECSYTEGSLLAKSKIENEGIMFLGNGISLHFHYHRTQKIYFLNIQYEGLVEDKIINKLLELQGLIYGYIYNVIDHRWQSEQNINMYKGANKFFGDLTLIKNKFGITVVDVSNNYGRSVSAAGIRYMAAQKQFFAPPIFRFFPKNKILSFKNAYKINELDNGVIEMELFSNILEEEYKTNRQKQKLFFEYFDLVNLTDDIAKRYKREGVPW